MAQPCKRQESCSGWNTGLRNYKDTRHNDLRETPRIVKVERDLAHVCRQPTGPTNNAERAGALRMEGEIHQPFVDVVLAGGS